jgi:hypothetical protein
VVGVTFAVTPGVVGAGARVGELVGVGVRVGGGTVGSTVGVGVTAIVVGRLVAVGTRVVITASWLTVFLPDLGTSLPWKAGTTRSKIIATTAKRAPTMAVALRLDINPYLL